MPRNVWVLSLTSFLRNIASEMLVHLLPLFLANILSVRIAVIGLIEGVAETTASLMKICSGWLSDKLRRRKGLTVGGYGLAALAMPLRVLLARTWPVALPYRFLDRMGKGMRTAPRDALIADSVDVHQRGVGFGLHRAPGSAGAFLGLPLAIAFVWRMQGGGLALDDATFGAVVAWAMAPAALAALVVGFGVKEVATGRPAVLPRFGFRGIEPRFGRSLVVTTLFTLGNSTDAFLILRAQDGGASVLVILAFLAGFNLVYTVLAGPAGALPDRVGRHKVIIGGWLL